MNWQPIERAIRDYAQDHKFPIYGAGDDLIVEVRSAVNISELSRAIAGALNVKVD